MTAYGQFYELCRNTGNLRSTLPICNLFDGSLSRNATAFGDGCNLTGIPLHGGRDHLANLGTKDVWRIEGQWRADRVQAQF
jgi:hypothetical protein